MYSLRGGTSGIGFELAKMFARNGHPLVTMARHTDDLAAASGSSRTLINRPKLKTLTPLTKRQQITIRIENREFPLTPRLGFQRRIGMDGDIPVEKGLIELVNGVGTDVYLAIVFQRVQVGVLEKVNLDLVEPDHQVPGIIGAAKEAEAELIDVVGFCSGFVPHGELGMDIGEHGLR